MKYLRMPIEIESPEMMGYNNLKFNLTESSVFDANLSDLNINLQNLLLCYGHHVGKPELCQLIANDYTGITTQEILLTAGAATALFIVNTSLLEPNEEVIVMHPNYGTNIETPRAMGCNLKLLSLKIENGFRINLDELESLITAQTKLISITTPHNPTGIQFTDEELKSIIDLIEKKNIYLLVDETYRDIPFGQKKPLAASLSDKVISVSSVSKAYGLPGIRIGWIVCKNKKLMIDFLAAKEQIQICNSVVDEEIAYQFMLRRNVFLPIIKNHLNVNFNILKDWLQSQSDFEYVLPEAGCVCFPKANDDVNIERFYKILNEKYGTYVGNGHWFEMDKHFMRIGFGWCTKEELKGGLENITATINEIK